MSFAFCLIFKPSNMWHLTVKMLHQYKVYDLPEIFFSLQNSERGRDGNIVLLFQF